MNRALIAIGKGQFSKQQIRSLEQVIKQNYKRYVSTEKLMVLWNLVPQGNMYNDYQEQQPSIIAIECEEGFVQAKRVNLFQTCMQDWVAITQQDINNVVISVLEKPTFNALLNRNNQHLTTLGKWQYRMHLLSSLLISKVLNKYYSFSSSI
ncbi:hypothetical protein BKI52_06025 [marine bacterium AO1-C]|nr:hypothetical protein BKI52_06025 [marine bacterium AO1-C]